MLEKDPVIPNNLARLQEIHAEVFRDKGIEIAYPQMDLHLRSVDGGAKPSLAAPCAGAAVNGETE